MENGLPERTRNGGAARCLPRYVLMIIAAVGTVGTCFLQAMTFASFQAKSDGNSPHLVGNNRQLMSSLPASESQMFASIADQVRAQIAQKGTQMQKEAPINIALLEDEEEFEIPMNDEVHRGRSEEVLPDFSQAPPPRNLTKEEYFGGCLLIKDDNHWLLEWLAFHYHVMPLRRLIVAIDPDSQTSPKNILARWNYLMKITTWTDDNFITPVPKRMIKAYDKNNTQLMYHRHRQNSFYTKCLHELKREKVPWVHLTDTDEFIAINYASGPLYNLTKHHPIQEPGSILRFLNHHEEATHQNPQCLFMPRYMFGNKESPRGLVERNVPKKNQVLKGINFLTQRFMFRHPKKMQNGKNLMHLQAMGKLQTMANVHRVSSSCPAASSLQAVNHIKTTLVKVHHYLGTQEQYFFRMDPRGGNTTQVTKGMGNFFLRDQQRYEQLNAQAKYSDSGARGWIRGFVQDVGLPMAEYLLFGIGQVGIQ